jgi:hypothetical protein
MLLRPSNSPAHNQALPTVTETDDDEPVLATHVAMATYEGNAAAGELSFIAGEDVEVLVKDGHERWKGRRREDPTVVGTFPPEYLDVNSKPDISNRLSSRCEAEEREGVTLTKLRCEALFPYQSQYEDDELVLKKGQELTVTKQAIDGWWFGTTEQQPNGGWFPGNYCEVCSCHCRRIYTHTKLDPMWQVLEELDQSEPEPTQPEPTQAALEQPLGPVYVAVHDYDPSFEDELALTQGVTIKILQQLDGGWWQGQLDDK